ncbi:protein lifeguard 1-like [Scleropages formosus]|uniref:Protein lifeguard 1-like n=1 Tax=Scleropages formosus TaxID=113540 RepID=A0A0N8JYU3_SCLFO|nr:protein lifeguard 1-like [Scleropages formosus]
MADISSAPIPQKTPNDPGAPGSAPPPYPHGEVNQQQPPSYMSPPYPAHPALYPPSVCSVAPEPPQPGFVINIAPPGEDGISKAEEPEIKMDSSVVGVLPDSGPIVDTTFEDKTIRRAFIRKVFTVVTVQLLITFSVVCIFTFSEVVQKAVQRNIWIYLSSYIIFVVVALCLTFSSSFSRKHPWNFVALGVVTLSLSYMVGTVASFHSTTAVAIAMGATLIISFTIVIFSAQTRVDFTICNGILLVLAVDLLMFGFFSIFFHSTVLQIVYGCLGALLYAMFLAVDCQLVMGREKYCISPEEYVFAALILYLDIIMIFLYLLILLGGSSNN